MTYSCRSLAWLDLTCYANSLRYHPHLLPEQSPREDTGVSLNSPSNCVLRTPETEIRELPVLVAVAIDHLL